MTAPIFSHYSFGRKSQIETEASDGVLSAILSQKGEDNEWHPVGYYNTSKTMAPVELNHEIHDKEMLATYATRNRINQRLQQTRVGLQGVYEEEEECAQE